MIDSDARDTAAEQYANRTRASRAAARPTRKVASSGSRSLSWPGDWRASPRNTITSGIRHSAATVQ